MAFSAVTLSTDDVSALVGVVNQHGSQLSALFASAGVLSGTLAVRSGTTLSSTLTVTSAVTLSGALAVTSGLTASSTLAVASTATFSAGATFASLVTLSGGFALGSTLALSADLTVASGVTASSTLTVTSAAVFSSTLRVTSAATFSGGVTITSGLLASATLGVVSQATFSGPVIFYGSATFTSTLSGAIVASAGFAQSATSAAFAGSASRASSVTFRGALLLVNSAVSLADDTNVTLSWGSPAFDTASFFASAAPSRVTMGAGVSYARLAAQVGFSAVVSGFRRLSITQNGGAVNGYALVTAWAVSSADSPTEVYCQTAVLSVVSGDYFEVVARHNAAATLSTLNDSRTWFSLEVW